MLQQSALLSGIGRSAAGLTAIIFLASCTSAPKREPREGKNGTAPSIESLTGAAEDTRPVIVALGDSLTAGLGVDLSESYPSKIQKKLDAEGYRYRVVNAGVSGDTSAQGLNRLGSVRDLHPTIVIVALGANDGLRGLPVVSTRRSLETIITELKGDGTKVVLAGILVPPNYGLPYSREFRDIFPELAGRHHLPLVPFLLAGVAANAKLNQADLIHPNAEGYDTVADNVWKVLKPLLRRSP